MTTDDVLARIDEALAEPDDIDELVDWQLSRYGQRTGYDHSASQPQCGHCGCEWHGLAITQQMVLMRYRVAVDDGYRHSDDESRVFCPGSDVHWCAPPPVHGWRHAQQRCLVDAVVDEIPRMREPTRGLFQFIPPTFAPVFAAPARPTRAPARWWRLVAPDRGARLEFTQDPDVTHDGFMWLVHSTQDQLMVTDRQGEELVYEMVPDTRTTRWAVRYFADPADPHRLPVVYVHGHGCPPGGIWAKVIEPPPVAPPQPWSAAAVRRAVEVEMVFTSTGQALDAADEGEAIRHLGAAIGGGAQVDNQDLMVSRNWLPRSGSTVRWRPGSTSAWARLRGETLDLTVELAPPGGLPPIDLPCELAGWDPVSRRWLFGDVEVR